MKCCRILFVALTFLSLIHCASLNSISMTSVPKDRSKPVSAEAKKTTFLGISFSNDYAYDLSRELKEKCKGGLVSGILTKFETVCYPLCLVVSYKITAKGYCQK